VGRSDDGFPEVPLPGGFPDAGFADAGFADAGFGDDDPAERGFDPSPAARFLPEPAPAGGLPPRDEFFPDELLPEDEPAPLEPRLPAGRS
jgi:hypothetical protein